MHPSQRPHRHARLLRHLLHLRLPGPSRLAPLSAVFALIGAPCPPVARAQSSPASVVVTANPLGNRLTANSVSVLAGDALLLQRGSSLGDTLEALPGVSATGFGPGASRPILRGLEGERLRILSNSGATLDASSLSDDHAVPIDPLIATRIEVLRGPAALFFGGNALAGAVNVLDNRIPELQGGRTPSQGLLGAAEIRAGGAAGERAGAALVEGGQAGQWAWHADAFGREAGLLRTPRFAVANSAQRTAGGAVGGSVQWGSLEWGELRLGAALDTFESSYGIVASEDITIDMQRHQLRLLGQWRRSDSAWPEITAQAHLNDYRHREIEGSGAVGTEFSHRGSDLRIDAQHAPWGPIKGAWGVQLESSDFAAQGAEAFVPSSRTARQALFVLEQFDGGPAGLWSLGGRVERSRIDSRGDADVTARRFGAPQQRSFPLRSLALGHVLPLTSGWNASVTLSHSERAPTAFELFARGLHAATGAYEVGDAALGIESGRQAEAALQWQSGPHQFRGALHRTTFSRFISLTPSGQRSEEEDAPLMNFRAVRARLQGWEIEGRWRVLQAPWIVDLSTTADRTHGINQDTLEPLPRLAPLRLRLGLLAAKGEWSWRWTTRHAATQTRVPSFDQPTPGHTVHDLSVARSWTTARSQALVFLKAQNLGHTPAYNASALQTVRYLAPQPGRSLSVGLRLDG